MLRNLRPCQRSDWQSSLKAGGSLVAEINEAAHWYATNLSRVWALAAWQPGQCRDGSYSEWWNELRVDASFSPAPLLCRSFFPGPPRRQSWWNEFPAYES